MQQPLSPIIQAKELLLLSHADHVIIIDASADKEAKERYSRQHLKGALYIDINTQLADIKPDAAHGGRHPLPTPEEFGKTLASLGINLQSHVIVYDHANASNAAARFWWMLASIGHKKVQVLDGGFNAAIIAGFPTSSKIETPAPATNYNITGWQLPLAYINDIDENLLNNTALVIDVRDAYRYNGEGEPIDLIAGHIPEAINIPFVTNLNSDGLYLSPLQLKNKYLQAFKHTKPAEVIVHCGSGVTACHTLLAVAYAGMEMPKLYVGSWSEWSRNNRPMITENR